MGKVKITVQRNKSYRIEGPVVLVDADGNEYDLSDKGDMLFLCRCGGSTTKPFCDGTHSKIGFQAAEQAVAQAEADGE